MAHVEDASATRPWHVPPGAAGGPLRGRSRRLAPPAASALGGAAELSRRPRPRCRDRRKLAAGAEQGRGSARSRPAGGCRHRPRPRCRDSRESRRRRAGGDRCCGGRGWEGGGGGASARPCAQPAGRHGGGGRAWLRGGADRALRTPTTTAGRRRGTSRRSQRGRLWRRPRRLLPKRSARSARLRGRRSVKEP